MEAEIRALVDAFVSDLTQMIRATALESVQQALTGEAVAAKPRGRKRGPAKAMAAKPKKGKRIRRTAAQVEKLGTSILAHVAKHPGQRLGDIGKALRVETKDARRPAFALVEAGKLKTTGQRGGTRYFAAGAAPRKAAKKRTAKKKTTRKKAAKRTAKKRKTAKRKTKA